MSMPDPDPEQRASLILDLNDCLSPASFWTPDRIVPSAWLQHAPFAFWLVQSLRPRTFVELGTHHGFSYLAFCQAVRRLGLATRCSAIDTWEGDVQSGFYGDDVLKSLSAYHDPLFADFSRLIRAPFKEAVLSFADSTIDLLHIDGQHDYASVTGDYETWRTKLSNRAVVLFHDTCKQEFGVGRLWKEISEKRPSFEFAHGHGLGVLGYGSEPPHALLRLFALSDEQRTTVRELYHRLGSGIGNHSVAQHAKIASVAHASPSPEPKRSDLHIHMAVLAPSFSDVRTRLPLRELAKIRGITASFSKESIELPRLPVDQPKVVILQRMGPRPVSYWRETLPEFVSRGWLVVSEFDDHPELVAAVHRRACTAADWNAISFGHAVQTSTPLLGAAMRAFNPEVAVFENAAFEIVRKTVEPRRDGTLRVFFGALNRGGVSSKLATLIGQLSVSRPKLAYEVIHDRAFFDALGDVTKTFHPALAYDRYMDVMATCDVALMPIEGTPGEAYKSDLKFIEASSRGLTSIASELIYGNTIRSATSGLIADTLDDWAPALARLYDDPGLRTKLAQTACNHVADHRMFATQVDRRIGWYKDLWARRNDLNESLFRRLPS